MLCMFLAMYIIIRNIRMSYCNGCHTWAFKELKLHTQSSPSISVGAVVTVPHSIHSWAKSYQPTALVSSSHITVTLNILHPQMQAKVGSPLRSFTLAIPVQLVVLNVKGKALHVFD